MTGVMKNGSRSGGGLVYSTESGRMCPDCRQPVASCACRNTAAPPGDGVVRISCQTKGRGGKSVTLVRGVALDPASLAQLARELRAACGSGGTVKDGVIEVQGDHRATLLDLLKKRGHDAR
jgi:translation initiation factor 1